MGKVIYHNTKIPQKKRQRVKSKKVYIRKISPFLNYALIVTFFSLVAFGLFRLKKTQYFNVKAISVNGTQNFVNSTDLKTMAEQQVLNKPIFNIESEKIESVLESSFQGAKDIQVVKSWPDSIEIAVSERVPLALLTNTADSESYLVDEDGYVLGIVDESKTNLPKINYNGKIHVGNFIDKDLVPLYLELLSSVDEQGLKASSVSVSDHYIDFYLDNKVNVYIGKSKDIKKSVIIISELFNQLKYEGKDVKKIDLRYDKVVVEY